MVKPLKVLVLAGGLSPEREVSLDSGRCVAEALRQQGCDVDSADPAEISVRNLNRHQWDIVFPVVHGTGGEDGILQRDLQQAGLLWVGSSAAASELTFDKAQTRARLLPEGVPLPPGFVVRDSDRLTDIVTQIQALPPAPGQSLTPAVRPMGGAAADQGSELPHPVVVKPTCQGSSVGVSMVSSLTELPAALETAFGFGSECLIEQYIPGRELTVPFIDGRIYPAVEIVVAETWYDYSAKYSDDRTQYLLVEDEPDSQLSRLTARACRLCDVTGIARVDFRVDPAGNFWLLEINTVPGMTSHSLVPKSAAAAGFSLGQLCLNSILHRLQLCSGQQQRRNSA